MERNTQIKYQDYAGDQLNNKKNRILVFLACLLICGGGQGILVNSYSIFVKPVCESLGFARFEFTMYGSIILVTCTALYPVLGILFKRPYFNRIMLFCAVISGLVPIGFSFSQDLWHFYILAIVQGIFFDGVSMTLTALIINCWFEENQGVVLGIVFAGSGAAAALMTKFGGWIIGNAGWESGYMAMGVISLCMLVPSTLLFQWLPLNPATSRISEKNTLHSANMSYRELLQMPQLFLMTGGCIGIGFTLQTFSTHIVAYTSDVGFSSSVQSTIVSLMMVLSMGSKILLGRIVDKYGVKWAVLTIGTNVVLAALLLLNITRIPYAYLMISLTAAFGISGGAVLSILVEYCFGKDGHTKGYPLMSTMSTIGMAIGGPVPGAIFDHMGSYKLVWYMVLAIILLAGVLFAAAINIADKEKKNVRVRESY